MNNPHHQAKNTLWQSAGRQAKQIAQLRTPGAKKAQIRMLLATLKEAMRHGAS